MLPPRRTREQPPIRRAASRSSGGWLLALALASACSSKTASSPVNAPKSAPVPLVEAVQVKRGRVPLEHRVTGTVRARNQVEIRAEVAAPILEVLVRSGEFVRKGQPLVRLQTDDLRNQHMAARADVAVANAAVVAAQARVTELKAQLGATRELAAKKFVSDLELAAHQAQLAVAEANVAQAQARVEQTHAVLAERQSRLDRAVIRAPVAGRVGRRNAEVGMLTNPATVLFIMGDLADLVVEVPLHEKHLGQVSAGTPVRIFAEATAAEPQEAAISRVSPFFNGASFSTTAEIDLRNGSDGLRPGMFVTVDVLVGQSEEVTLVPQAAVWKDPQAGTTGVYAIALPRGAEKGGDEVHEVSLVPVEVVASGRATVGVEGLSDAAWVVTIGQHLLRTQEAPKARVRPTDWAHVLGLQERQGEDLLNEFLLKQQKLAKQLGPAPPSNRDFVSGTTAAAGGSTVH